MTRDSPHIAAVRQILDRRLHERKAPPPIAVELPEDSRVRQISKPSHISSKILRRRSQYSPSSETTSTFRPTRSRRSKAPLFCAPGACRQRAKYDLSLFQGACLFPFHGLLSPYRGTAWSIVSSNLIPPQPKTTPLPHMHIFSQPDMGTCQLIQHISHTPTPIYINWQRYILNQIEHIPQSLSYLS
jgi:hypothetical protein